MNSNFIPTPLRGLPWRILIPLTALVLFGATVLWSAAGGNWSPYAWKHIFNFGLFLSLAIGISRLPEHTFRKAAYPIYGGLVFLLMLVEAVGKVGGGSQRWLNIGFMNLQPSELMKPGIVLVMALFYATLPPTLIRSWRALVPPLLLLGMPAGLVMLQPDLGTGLAICFGAVVVVFLSGTPIWWFLSGGAAAAVVAPLAFFSRFMIINANACWYSWTRKPTCWVRVTISPNPRSRSARAASLAKGWAMARRAI
jgi:rod shape determining protein RodA